jgi:hypothetical protein
MVWHNKFTILYFISEFVFLLKVKVNWPLCFILSEHHAIELYWERQGKLHAFLTLELDEGEWLVSRSAAFPTGKEILVPIV